jgi:hypothetical protein
MKTNAFNYRDEIDKIITSCQYNLLNKDKSKLLLSILREELKYATDNNPHIRSYFDKLGIKISDIRLLKDIPFIPVQIFKEFDLLTCKKEDVVRVIRSSGTTNQVPSKIPLNKATSLRQMKALIATLKFYLGNKRRPFLVIDTEDVNKANFTDLTARGAAIQGLSSFAKRTYFLLKKYSSGELILDTDLIKEILDQLKNEEIYVFGFTFIIWSIFYPQINSASINLNFKSVKLFHSGGWKRLKSQSVSKEIFNQKISEIFCTDKGNIIDFYGMAEQTGVIFLDCEYQNKHVPDFAEVIIRNPLTLEECKIDEIGLIEVLSVLSDSYYSQGVLTEDLGILKGIDDCPCGRKGKYFQFISRVEKAEIRGCGDTFATKVQL